MPAVLLLITAFVAPLLVGCNGHTPSAADREGVTIVFKHGKLSGPPEVFDAILREFERRHPGVTVQEEVLPASTDQQHQFYAVNLEGRSAGFDLLAADIIWVQEFARAGWIAEVDDHLPPAARDDVFPEALRAATYQNRLYAIPWYVDAGILYYRRDLLNRYGLTPPRTWPELVAAVRIIRTGERNPALAGFVWQGKQYEGLVCIAHELVWGRGGDLLEGPTPESTEALRFLNELLSGGGSPASVATADEEASRHLFGAGRAIFMRNWTYAWSLLDQQESAVHGKVGLAPLPAFPDRRSVSVMGGWLLAVPRRAAHPREAGLLIEYLASPEVQRRMAGELGYGPVRRSLYRDHALLKAQPWLRSLLPVLAAAKPRPVTPYYLMLSQVLQPELSAAVVGTKPPQAALASARRQMTMLGLDRDVEAP